MTEVTELSLLPEERPEIDRRSLALGLLPPNEELESPEPIPELINAIRSVGLLQPIVVGELNGEYHIHGGRRRLKAMRKLAEEWDTANRVEGVDEPPKNNPFGQIDVYVVDDQHYNAHEALTLLLQNTIRANPVAELRAIEKLMKKGYSKEMITKELGMEKSTIDKRLKLQRLHPDLRLAMEEGKFAVSSAEKAARLPEPAQERLSKAYIEKGKITGKDVEDQMRARTQAAAQSESLGALDDLPTIDDVQEEENGAQDTSNVEFSQISGEVVGGAYIVSTEQPEHIVEAQRYLEGRLADARMADRNRRQKWTKKDIEAVEAILEAL